LEHFWGTNWFKIFSWLTSYGQPGEVKIIVEEEPSRLRSEMKPEELQIGTASQPGYQVLLVELIHPPAVKMDL